MFGRSGDNPPHAPRRQSQAWAGMQRDPQRTSSKADNDALCEILAETGHRSVGEHSGGVRGDVPLGPMADRWGIAFEIEVVDVGANQGDET